MARLWQRAERLLVGRLALLRIEACAQPVQGFRPTSGGARQNALGEEIAGSVLC
jgi:hypothetical protein